MKNQYVGDIGDYGKYGLLRFIQSKGISIGVNWYLTPDDTRTDGKFIDYLNDTDMRGFDGELFDEMKRLAFLSNKSVQMVEESGVLKNALFYNDLLDLDSLDSSRRTEQRKLWHVNALKKLSGVELVFADPDNSLSSTKSASQKGNQKFILPNEVMDYYERGQNVVYYHHRSRKNEEGWLAEKTIMKAYLPDSKLLAVSSHKWANRAYIFVVHEKDYAFYKNMLTDFLCSSWGGAVHKKRPFFTDEKI